MIGYIEGRAKILRPDAIVVSVSGLGYLIHCPSSYIENLTAGDQVELFIETKVSENDIVLFGLRTPAELDLFKELCKVQGLGGKTALALISHLGVDGICQAVIGSDPKTIATTKGIGQKTAQKVCVDLKKHVESSYDGASKFTLEEGTASIVRSALEAMGITSAEANNLMHKVVSEYGSDMNTTEIITASLKLRQSA